MSFYQLLQLPPAALYRMRQEASQKRERRRVLLAVVVRALLIVSFAVMFIAPMSALFGKENSALAVVLFCLFLSIRFVDFGYCLQDGLVNLLIVLVILTGGPILAQSMPFGIMWIIHGLSLFLLLIMTAQRPEMGYGSLLGFGYVFLCGNPVSGALALKRFYLALLGYGICGLLYLYKHRGKWCDVRFHHILRDFSLNKDLYLWQLRMALGLSLMLSIGMRLGLERVMWAGFATSSLLAEHRGRTAMYEKFLHRLLGVLEGCLLFLIVVSLVPPSILPFLPLLGGFILGLCAHYRRQMVMNTFGALLVAEGIYGWGYSVFLRLGHTLGGLLFAVVFYYLYELVLEKFLRKETALVKTKRPLERKEP